MEIINLTPETTIKDVDAVFICHRCGRISNIHYYSNRSFEHVLKDGLNNKRCVICNGDMRLAKCIFKPEETNGLST
jgi:hypothetical protein